MTYSDLPPAPPSGDAYGSRAAAGPRPSTVTNAVRLMFLQVAISVISLIVLLATKNDLKKKLQADNANFTQSTLDAAITVGIVVGVVFIVLYALLAWQVGKGKNWARIVTWVLAGLGIISGLASFGQTQTTANRITGIISLVVAIAIVVFLAMKPSNEYFRRR